MIVEVKIRNDIERVKVTFLYHVRKEVTKCIFFLLNPVEDVWHKISTGKVKKNFSDKHDRKVGRKIAFSKALDEFMDHYDLSQKDSRAIRSTFWVNYIRTIRLPNFKKVKDQAILLES